MKATHWRSVWILTLVLGCGGSGEQLDAAGTGGTSHDGSPGGADAGAGHAGTPGSAGAAGGAGTAGETATAGGGGTTGSAGTAGSAGGGSSGSAGTAGSAGGGASGSAGGGASGSAGGGASGSAGGGASGSAGGGASGSAGGGSSGSAGGGSSGSGGASVATGTIYAALARCATDCFVGDLVAIDVTTGAAVHDTSIVGTSDLGYRAGALLVARGAGHTRLSILDPDTLVVTGTRILPWDPERAAFSADGRYMYAVHGEGYVSQVRVSDGAITAEVQFGARDSNADLGVALDPIGTWLGVTQATGSAVSNVALVRVSAESMTVVHDITSQPFSTSNCDRQVRTPVFDRTGTHLAVHDPNCDAFDVYDVATGALNTTASVMFPRGGGTNFFSSTIADALGQFWAVDEENLFRTSSAAAARQAVYPLGVPTTAGLVADPTGQNIYLFTHDPRRNGVFKVNPETGAVTRLPWNLDLIPYDSAITALTYAAR